MKIHSSIKFIFGAIPLFLLLGFSAYIGRGPYVWLLETELGAKVLPDVKSSINPRLPTCASDELKKKLFIPIVKQILGADFIATTKVAQKSFNNEKGIRLCSASLSTTLGTEDVEIEYVVRWTSNLKSEWVVHSADGSAANYQALNKLLQDRENTTKGSPKVLRARQCPDPTDAFEESSCRGRCVQTESISSFLVDTQHGTVTVAERNNSKAVEPRRLQGCKIDDEKNWSCRQEQGSEITETASKDGKIVKVHITKNTNSFGCFVPE